MGIPFRAENSHYFPNIGKKYQTIIKIAENRCGKKMHEHNLGKRKGSNFVIKLVLTHLIIFKR